MNEETIRKEFEEWAIDEGFSVDRYIDSELYRYTKTQISYAAWLAATRRADRKVREECADICDKEQKTFLQVCNKKAAIGALACRNEILDTIRRNDGRRNG